jgi:hypothetical protein
MTSFYRVSHMQIDDKVNCHENIIHAYLHSAVVIATRYGLDGPGIEFRCVARVSTRVQAGPGTHPASYTMGTGSYPGLKRSRCGVDHSSHLSPMLKFRTILLLHLWGLVACSRAIFTFTFYHLHKSCTHYAIPTHIYVVSFLLYWYVYFNFFYFKYKR